MGILKTVNRSAVVQWCPSSARPDLLATASIAGTTDFNFDSSAHLEIFSVNSSQNRDQDRTLHSMGQVEISDRVNCLSWGGCNPKVELGMIAGGTANGSIELWNPNKVLNGAEDFLMHSLQKHTAVVSSLDFNPKRPILASGGDKSEVFIWDLGNSSNPQGYAPGAPPQQPGNISMLKWNLEFDSILATAYDDGRVFIWDLRRKRPIVSIPGANTKDRIPSCKCISWSPKNTMEIVIACDDDSKPVVQLWNLKNTHFPADVFTGHTAGVLSTSWSTNDPNFLLSTGKDKRTICWNMSNGKRVSELEDNTSEYNYDVQWAPHLPTIISTASFDGQIRIHSLHDPQGVPAHAEDTSVFMPDFSTAPKWLQRPAGATFGFGGKLISLGENTSITVQTFASNPEVLERCNKLEEALATADKELFCVEKAEKVQDEQEREQWAFMQTLFNIDNPREAVLNQLGFSKQQISAQAQQILASKGEDTKKAPEEASVEEEVEQVKKESDDVTDLFGGNEEEDPFGSIDSNDPFAHASYDNDPFSSIGDSYGESEGSALDAGDASNNEYNGSVSIVDLASQVYEKIALLQGLGKIDQSVLSCLVVGNHKDAVDLCIKQGNLADALMIAFSINDPSIANYARQQYLKQKSPGHYLNLLSHIVKGDLMHLIAASNIEEWKCTLAILCTYASENDFSSLCRSLSELLLHAGNSHGAVICSLCARDLDGAVKIWASAGEGGNQLDSLQQIIEKSKIFQHAIDVSQPTPFLAEKFTQYAELLAAQGELERAQTYVSFSVSDERYRDSAGYELYNRIRSLLSSEPANTSPFVFREEPAPASQPAASRPAEPQQPAAAPVSQPFAATHPPAPAASYSSYSSSSSSTYYHQGIGPTVPPTSSQQQIHPSPPASAPQPVQAPVSSQYSSVAPVPVSSPFGFAAAPSLGAAPLPVMGGMSNASYPPVSAPQPVAPSMGPTPVQMPPVSRPQPDIPEPEQLPEEFLKDPPGTEHVNRFLEFLASAKARSSDRAAKIFEDCHKRVSTTLPPLLRQKKVSEATMNAFVRFIDACESGDKNHIMNALQVLNEQEHYSALTSKIMLGLKKIPQAMP